MSDPDLRPMSPPPLEVQTPLCGICGSEVEMDDRTFRCDNCQVAWGSAYVGTARGQWLNPESPRCPSIDGRFLPGGTWAASSPRPDICRCVLAVGHDTKHHQFTDAVGYAHRSWLDADSATAAQLPAGSS